jgi:hypothetical protein
MSIPESTLYAICDRASFFAFLHDQLSWPVDPEDTFLYSGPQLQGEVATGAQISQIVPFTAGDPFTIMLVEFETAFRRTDLRAILRKMREEIRKRAKYGGRNMDEIVFVCVTEGYRGFRFVRFEEQTGRQPKMSVFGWDRYQPGGVRTLLEYNLPALKMPPTNVLGEPDWSQARWDEAWDVEKVTREFFREYRATFEAVEQMIATANPGTGRDWRLFTQRLFNRLMFIQFLSKRGWLRFAGSTDYLFALYTRSSGADENFYHDRLYWVFFYGLGSGAVGQEAHSLPELQERRGDVPCLNDSLFEMVNDGSRLADSSDGRGVVQIPNPAFERIVQGLFARWNFTISESTPLDVEVAVDPEMLGKVFEELVTGRHESGSYYTPRGIVAFMCREPLKHYLTAAGVPAEAAATFVDDRSASDFRETDFETTLAALKRVRVVDPACGSGAYLLGMLHELVELRKLLFNPNHKDDPRNDYERKLDIIRRNLYGVDLDEFAVNIARLRLWLSLAVEYEGSTPEPLPNLGFKIEQGDSLTAPNPQGNTQTDIRAGLIDEFGGFDIVVANPPYLSTKHGFGQDNRALLMKTYQTARGQFDAYALFLERALSLLCDTGCYTYIVPKSVLTNSNMLPVRTLLNINRVIAIADPGTVFEASVEPIIIIGRKNNKTNNIIKIFIENYFRGALAGSYCASAADVCTPAGIWNIATSASATKLIANVAGLPRFGDLFEVKRGVECGKKDATIFQYARPDTYPLLRGEDLDRFTIRFADHYIVRGRDDKTFKPKQLYDAPKLIIRRVANQLIAAIDTQGYHVLNTIYVAKARQENSLLLEYVCALLNSRVMNDYFHAVFVNDDKLFPYIRKEQLDQLPIAMPSPQDEAVIVSLVRQLTGSDTEQSISLQEEIETLISKIFESHAV